MKTNNFAGLDLLRFLAAACVCLFHLAFMNTMAPNSAAYLISGGAHHYDAIHDFTSVGWVGVQIFFVISGFVIFGSTKVNAAAFVRGRFLRLYPAVWICAPISLAIAIAFAAFPIAEVPTRIVRSVLLWPKGNWVDGVYWTLGIEIVFYAIVFLLLAINARRHIVWICLALGSVSSTYWLLQLGWSEETAHPLLQNVMQLKTLGRYFELSLIPHGCYFAIGALLYVVLCESGSRWLWLAIGYFVCGALVEIQSTSVVQGLATNFQMNTLLAQSIWFVSLVALVLSVQFGQLLAKPLSLIQARMLASITYPLYLLHTTVGAALLAMCNALGINAWIALVLVLPSIAGASYLVHKLLEQPLKKSVSNMIDFSLQGLSLRKFQRL